MALALSLSCEGVVLGLVWGGIGICMWELVLMVGSLVVLVGICGGGGKFLFGLMLCFLLLTTIIIVLVVIGGECWCWKQEWQ